MHSISAYLQAKLGTGASCTDPERCVSGLCETTCKVADGGACAQDTDCLAASFCNGSRQCTVSA